MAPTRLFVDAGTTAEWRDKGFFPVLNEQGGQLENNLEASLLYNMIRLGREQPLPPHSAVPEHIQLGLQRKNECPLPAEFDTYAQKKPRQGMPLAITGLSDSEYGALQQWIRKGPSSMKSLPADSERTAADRPLGNVFQPYGVKKPAGLPLPV